MELLSSASGAGIWKQYQGNEQQQQKKDQILYRSRRPFFYTGIQKTAVVILRFFFCWGRIAKFVFPPAPNPERMSKAIVEWKV